MSEHHPEDDRPRMDVEVVDTSISASAEAVTRPAAGEDDPQRTGEVRARIDVTVECCCGNEVRVGTVQKGVICQGCGRRWQLL